MSTLRGRIKHGATIGQDFCFFRWPRCTAADGRIHSAPPDTVFDCERQGDHWTCSADGYGYGITGRPPGKYGNGSLFVFGIENVQLVDFAIDAGEEMEGG